MSTSQSSDPPACRLFLALSLPGHVKDGLPATQQQLRAALQGSSIRWTRRDQLHVTLTFLGNVQARRLDDLTEAVRNACAGHAPLRLRAEEIGFFPGVRRPRIVWTHVRDRQNRLLSLQRSVATATAAFTEESPTPPFRGHVTLGRWRAHVRSQADTLSRLIRAMEGRVFGEWTADRIDIIHSRLSPTGSRYATLGSVPLAPRR